MARDLSHLDARLEADLLDGLADNAVVSSWSDGVVTVAGGSGPNLRKAALNGQHVLEFDGSQWLEGSLPSTRAASWSRTIVARLGSYGGDTRTLTGSSRSFPEGLNISISGFSTSPSWRVGVSATSNFALSDSPIDLSWHVLTVTWDHATQTATLYKDGAANGSGVNTITPERDSNVFVVGADGAGGSSSHLYGFIAAIYQENGAVWGSADRAVIHSHVQDVYGITVSDYEPDDPSQDARVDATTATATVVAGVPVVLGETVVSGGGPATAAGQAHAPTVTGTTDGSARVAAETATATAVAHAPTVTATASASITVPTATATATAHAPTVTGEVPVPAPVTAYLPAGADPMTSHRVESWWVDLLDQHDAPLGVLDGVTGGAVDQNVARVISGGGTLDVKDVGQDIPWLTARVQIWWEVQGVDPWPLGVFLLSAPVEQHSSVRRSWRVELLDKLLVLDEDKVDGSYSLAAGTVVTDAVRTIIASSGETAVAITDSAETLTSGMVWPAGTSKLRICNDLLASINYFSLRCDGHGRYVAAPYLAPASRPVVRRFVPAPDAIHLPEFTRDRDLAGIPNKTVLVSSGSSDTEALVGVASNTDPDSPTSQPSRGRWIVHTEEGVEATSQTVIDDLAARRLIDLSTVTATETIQHAAIPLDLNDVVTLTGDDLPEVRAAVQSWSLTLVEGSLMRTRIREVAA